MNRSRTAIKAYFREARWISVLFPLLMLAIYLVGFSYLLEWAFPEGSPSVNSVFATSASKYVLLLVTGLYLVFFGLFKILRGEKPTSYGSPRKPSPGDLILILLPLTPVVQYIFNNQDILSPGGSLVVLALFSAFSFLFIIVAPTILGVIGSSSNLMILGLAFTFTITNMASLSALFSWYERGNLILQLAWFTSVYLVGLLVYNFVGRKFMYFVVAAFFVANSATQWANDDPPVIEPDPTLITNNLIQLVGGSTPSSTPSIYLLVYDAYVANETMLASGIDNSAQEEYLETMGFKLYPETYSIAGASVSTMSRTLNASKSYFGKPRRAVSGDGILHNLLKGFGYSTHGIFPSDYFFQGVDSSYDFSYPSLKATHLLLTKAIFMGEFRFDVEFDSPSHEKFVEHRLKSLGKDSDLPRFVYVHNDLPGHSQNSGKCRPDEIDLYEERLQRANVEMKQDLELLARKDPGAIVILAGDHGPYLTKNCTETDDHYDISEITRHDIQDRLGTFLAIKWPDDSYDAYDTITIQQDLFLAILAYLFEDDRFLDEKIRSQTLSETVVSGASVLNGVIIRGANDGEPLFLTGSD